MKEKDFSKYDTRKFEKGGHDRFLSVQFKEGEYTQRFVIANGKRTMTIWHYGNFKCRAGILKGDFKRFKDCTIKEALHQVLNTYKPA